MHFLCVSAVLGRPAQRYLMLKMSSERNHTDVVSDVAADSVKLEAEKFQRLLELSLSGVCRQSCYLVEF